VYRFVVQLFLMMRFWGGSVYIYTSSILQISSRRKIIYLLTNHLLHIYPLSYISSSNELGNKRWWILSANGKIGSSSSSNIHRVCYYRYSSPEEIKMFFQSWRCNLAVYEITVRERERVSDLHEQNNTAHNLWIDHFSLKSNYGYFKNLFKI